MNQMNQPGVTQAQAQALIQKAARWMMKHPMVASRRVEYDDVHQEVAMLWLGCQERWDPKHNVTLPAFFWRSAMMAVPTIVRQISGSDEKHALTCSMDAKIKTGHEETTFHDVLADKDTASPEDSLLRREAIDLALRANPLFARLVQLSVEEPQELRAELEAVRSQAEYARSIGVDPGGTAPSAITPEMLRRTFQFNWRDRKAAINLEEVTV